jgi:hypothetical protein
MWAALPGVALLFVLLWTWRIMHTDRHTTTGARSGAAAVAAVAATPWARGR